MEKIVEHPESYSGLSLAYIGDSVFDLLIKTKVVAKTDMQPEKYHKYVTGIVKATNQAKVLHAMLDRNFLTEDEIGIYKRGRNSAPHSKAKNASMIDYLTATGFEALIGYLYLAGEQKRLDEIIDFVFDTMDNNAE